MPKIVYHEDWWSNEILIMFKARNLSFLVQYVNPHHTRITHDHIITSATRNSDMKNEINIVDFCSDMQWASDLSVPHWSLIWSLACRVTSANALSSVLQLPYDLIPGVEDIGLSPTDDQLPE